MNTRRGCSEAAGIPSFEHFSAWCASGMLEAWHYDRTHDIVSRRTQKTIPTTNAVRNTLGSWTRLAAHFGGESQRL